MKSSLRVALPLKNQGKDHKLKKARSLTRLLHRGTTQIRDAYRQEKAPASSRPTFCYSFGLDRSRNEFRNVEKFSAETHSSEQKHVGHTTGARRSR